MRPLDSCLSCLLLNNFGEDLNCYYQKAHIRILSFFGRNQKKQPALENTSPLQKMCSSTLPCLLKDMYCMPKDTRCSPALGSVIPSPAAVREAVECWSCERGIKVLISLPTGERLPPELVPCAELCQQGRVHARDCRGTYPARFIDT